MLPGSPRGRWWRRARKRGVTGTEHPSAPSVPSRPGSGSCSGCAGAGVTPEQCRKHSSCGFPSGPSSPGQGGEERNRKCSESCGGARGTGCAAGQGPPGKTPKPSARARPVPTKQRQEYFRPSRPGCHLGKVSPLPRPLFSSGASCSSLTVAGPERWLEASALGSSSCLLAVFDDTRHSLGLAPLPQEFARHERRKRRGRVPSQRCQVPLQLRSSLTQRATNPARDSGCGLEEIAEAPGAPISPCVKMWIITRGCFPREG